MKKRIAALFLAVALTVQGGMPVMAENVYSADSGWEDMVIEPARVELAQEGAMISFSVDAGDGAVLKSASEFEWEEEFRAACLNAMENLELEIDVFSMKIPYEEKDDAISIYRDVINENGQLFYMDSGLATSNWNGYMYTFYLGYVEKYDLDSNNYYTTELDRDTLKADKIIYEERVNTLISQADSNMTDLEKALLCHDFIVRECDYDYENYLAGTIPDESYRSYGVFVNNVAVCNGYALAFMDCMKRLGVSSKYLASSEINHAWNMVYLDGHWYHVDATWSDPIYSFNGNGDYWKEGSVKHSNFVLSDTEIESTGHKGWYEDAPAADNDNSYAGYVFRTASTAMNYYDGSWYYIYGGDIVSADVDGSSRTVMREGNYLYLHNQGNKMYFADSSGIYYCTAPNFSDVTTFRSWDTDGYKNYKTQEFTIKSSQLVAVISNSSTSDIKRLVLSIPKETYTVSFNSNGGTSVSDATGILKGGYVTEPEEPERDGYDFKGWYKDAGCTQKWNFTTDTVEGSVTLYAGWEKLPVEAVSVEVTPSSVELEVGNTITLTATVLPADTTNKSVTWTSSNPEVAAVDSVSGVITAKSEGTAVITAETQNHLQAEVSVKVSMPETYTVSFNSNGGTSVSDATGILKGGYVTEPEEPERDGYDFKGWYKDAGCTQKWDFTTDTVEENLTLYAGWSKPELSDVDKNSWMWEFVKYAYDNEIMSGVGMTDEGKVIFAPEENLTREQFVQVLFNNEGAEPVSGSVSFTDVEESWYTNAVIWAVTKGVASGYAGGRFGVGEDITREQLAMMLYNYAVFKGYDVEAVSMEITLAEFADAGKVSDWAREAMQWAVANEIMSGEGENLNPDRNASRAHCATMLYNFIVRYEQ